MEVISIIWPQSDLNNKISPIEKKSDQVDTANIWDFTSKPSAATEMVYSVYRSALDRWLVPEKAYYSELQDCLRQAPFMEMSSPLLPFPDS